MGKAFIYRSYTKGELAQLYDPFETLPAARRKLMQWISLQPRLVKALTEAGMKNRCRNLTPAQVRLIVEALGEP